MLKKNPSFEHKFEKMKALNLLVSPFTLLITRVAGFLSENEISSTSLSEKMDHKGLNPLVLTVWTGENGQDWHDAANWSNGLPEEGKHAYIPTYPKGDQFPVITQYCIVDFTIKNDGMIKNMGEVKILSDGLFQNYGIFENKNDAKFINKGNCFNAGALINTGYIDNQHIFSNGKMIENGGTFLGEDRVINTNNINKEGFIDGPNQEQVNKTARHLDLIYGF